MDNLTNNKSARQVDRDSLSDNQKKIYFLALAVLGIAMLFIYLH
jgi:hypothetical protein